LELASNLRRGGPRRTMGLLRRESPGAQCVTTPRCPPPHQLHPERTSCPLPVMVAAKVTFPQGAEAAPGRGKPEKELRYNADLRAPLETSTQKAPRAEVHAIEFKKIINGECRSGGASDNQSTRGTGESAAGRNGKRRANFSPFSRNMTSRFSSKVTSEVRFIVR